MTKSVSVSSSAPKTETWREPAIVSVVMDGQEVQRFENGVRLDLVDQTDLPIVLKIYWDGKLMYHIDRNAPNPVQLDLLKGEFEALHGDRVAATLQAS